MRGGVIQARYLGGRPGPQVVQAHGAADSFAVDPVRLGLARGGGQPLPDPVRAKMEAAFGTDFSRVRVHVGPQASRIGAIAFTMGQDIYFAPGQYRPETIQGQQLLGHELAHVVQQRQGRVKAPASGVAVVQDRMLEAEADRLGMRAALQRMPARPSTRLVPPFADCCPTHAARPLQRMLKSREMNPGEVDAEATSVTAWKNSSAVAMDLFGTASSGGGDHAEDRVASYIVRNDIRGETLVLYLTKTPCTSVERTDDKGDLPTTGKGCAEMLMKLAEERDLRFQIAARNVYSPAISLADRASIAAMKAMMATGRFAFSVDKPPRSKIGKSSLSDAYAEKTFDENGFLID